MAVIGRLAVYKHQIGVEIQPTGSGHRRIECAEPSGRGIARIGETSQALLLTLGVEPLEGAAIHDGFAAHLELRFRGGNMEWQRANGACVFGDLLSHQSVAASYRLRKLPVAIVGGHGEPVQLQLSHAGNVADTVQEIAQLLLVQRVIEAEHLGGVGYLDESLTWLAANALRRGIRREQLRVRLFKIRKLAHQGVVFGVGDLRVVEDVVEPLMMAQSLPELFGLLADFVGNVHLL